MQPGQTAPQTFGLRDDEMGTALDVMTHVLPCLALFTSRMPDGDLHETFADVFTVLKVNTTSFTWHSRRVHCPQGEDHTLHLADTSSSSYVTVCQ